MLYGAPLEKDPSPVVRKGRAGAHSGSRSRSSSVFREAVRHGHDPTVSKLAVWADGHPWVLSARILQMMSDQLGRDGRRRDWLPEECPPVATNYVHQILRPQFPSMGARNRRELDTLGEIMDRLAVGEFGRAADLVTQRFKAVEMALHDGDWTRATHLELLADPKRLLTSRDEEELIARELRDEMKLKRYLDDAVGTKNKDRSMPGDKGKGVGKDREKATGGRKSDVSGNLTTQHDEKDHGKRETGKGNENGKGGDKRRR